MTVLKKKSFIEFLHLMKKITECNILFIEAGKTFEIPKEFWKYKEEMIKIGDTVNSFEFVKRMQKKSLMEDR